MDLKLNDNELETVIMGLYFAGFYCDIVNIDDKNFKELYLKIAKNCEKEKFLKIFSNITTKLKGLLYEK